MNDFDFDLRMVGIGILIVILIAMGACSFEVIEPGYVGIKVNMMGSARGVQDIPVVTGRVFFNPITTKVIEYPTFVQTAVWTRDDAPQSPGNEEVTFNSREGMLLSADTSLSYQIAAERVPDFYMKFRKDNLDEFTHGFMRAVARDAFNEESVRYSVEELYGEKKEELLATVRKRVNDTVAPFGVSVEQFGFMGAVRLPDEVLNALNAKITATQRAQQLENEVAQARAEGEKRIAVATAEAKANRLLADSISAPLLQWKTMDLREKEIAKWNGAYPAFLSGGAGGATPLLDVSRFVK